MLAQAIRKKLGKAVKEEKGFTLIELLAVIVIMGIIAIIAIPMISGLIKNTKDKADLATARQIYEASRLYISTEKNGTITTENINILGSAAVAGGAAAVDGLQIKGYLETPLVLPSTKTNITGGTVSYTNGALTSAAAVTIFENNKTTATRTYTAEEIMKTELNN